MSAERSTTCLDFERRFDGFLDGELDALSMRSMALHASHCETCGAALESGERVQEILSQAVAAEVAKLDTSLLWGAIERSLEPVRSPWRDRMGRLWSTLDARRWMGPVPALAMSGAIAVSLAAILWMEPAPTQVASTWPMDAPRPNNQAQIERIESSAPHVAVWSEPESHTTAIWVASYEPEGTP